MLPFLLFYDHWKSNELKPKQEIALGLLWALSVVVGYLWLFFKHQDRSELRRSYRFRAVDPQDDADVAGAKRVLLDTVSTVQEREQAVDLLLARGALFPYRRDLVGESLAWVSAIAMVALFFFLAVWLPQMLLE